MKKRGQLAIFILFGLIILLAFAVISYLKSLNTIPEKEYKKPSQSSNLELPLNNYIQNCVSETARNAVQIIGLQGGYLKPAHFLDNFLYTTSYLYYNGESYMPSKKELEDEISAYVLQNIGKCTNLSLFEEQGYKITASEPTASTLLNADSVLVEVNFQLSFAYENTAIELPNFSANIPVRLSYIRDVVEGIVNETVLEPNWLSAKSLTRRDLSIAAKPRYPALVYFVRDDKSNLRENEPYTFIFATKYDFPK